VARKKLISKANDIWDFNISKVVEWAEKRNLTVNFGKKVDERYESWEKAVYIRELKDREETFYTLLHECGHFLIDSNDKKFKVYHPQRAFETYTESIECQNVVHKVSILAEEVEAWKRGRALAERLDLVVQNKRYNLTSSKSIFSYMHCLANQ
jgi:hypothetical protein